MGLVIDIPGTDGEGDSLTSDDRLDEILTALGVSSDPATTNGPGLPGLGLAGDWLEWLKKNPWWLLAAGALLILMTMRGDRR